MICSNNLRSGGWVRNWNGEGTTKLQTNTTTKPSILIIKKPQPEVWRPNKCPSASSPQPITHSQVITLSASIVVVCSGGREQTIPFSTPDPPPNKKRIPNAGLVTSSLSIQTLPPSTKTSLKGPTSTDWAWAPYCTTKIHRKRALWLWENYRVILCVNLKT